MKTQKWFGHSSDSLLHSINKASSEENGTSQYPACLNDYEGQERLGKGN